MKILVGPDSFKDSVSANEFCDIARDVIETNWPEDVVYTMPLADGGEGTVEALVDGSNGEMMTIEVTGPLGTTISAHYGLIEAGTVAVIEMASASGLPLVPIEKRNPMLTTTYGTGELIAHAIKRGVKKIIVGIGGSATSDGGLGMLMALGYQCLNACGETVSLGGQGLLELASILVPETNPLEGVEVLVACDVDNPLYGVNGAAYVYGPQKGADETMVEELDQGLKNFAQVVEKSLGKQIDTLAGGGAAGGLGAALYAYLNAELKPGFEIVREQVGLDAILKMGIDLVITAEGQMNHQSLRGKLPVELAKLAKSYGSKTIAFVGARDLKLDEVKEFGFIGVVPIANKPMTLEASMANGKTLIREALEHTLSIVHH